MMENNLLLSEFANEDGFELNNYIASLFECISTLSEDDHTDFEPAQ